jgi:predicted RNA-binding protein with PIN domain
MATDNEQAQFVQHLSDIAEKVELEAAERHVMGAQEYGSFAFLENDTLEMAYEELLDLINYAKYTAIKIKLLQEFVAQKAAAVGEPDTTGAGGFVPTSELMKGFHG